MEKVISAISLQQWFLTRNNLENIWQCLETQFWLTQLNKGAGCYYRFYKAWTGTHNNKLYGPNVKSAKDGKTWFTGDTVIWATLLLHSSCLSGLSLLVCKTEMIQYLFHGVVVRVRVLLCKVFRTVPVAQEMLRKCF